MAYADRNSVDTKERLITGALIVAFHAAVLWLIISALGIDPKSLGEPVDDMLKAFDITPVVEIEEPDEEEAAPEAPKAAADEKQEAVPVVAPEPEVIVPTENPIVAAPEPDVSDETDSGAAEEPGPGAGADDAGDGSGSGDGGDGSGGGGDGDGNGSGFAVTKPRKIAGNISARDYRKATGESSQPGAVTVFYTVQTNGRVTGCRVARASDNPARDALTCKLVEQRWRYEPARNAAGEPVAAETGWRQRWWPKVWKDRPDTPPEGGEL